MNKKKNNFKNNVLIVAEIGNNHEGNINNAKRLIEEAYRAGVDAVKFQTFQVNKRISSKVKSVKYAETITGIEETLNEMFNRLAMPFEDQFAGRMHC